VLVSDWKVERGIAQAKTCDGDGREPVALTGSLDYVNERFNDVTVAVVDGKGCASAPEDPRLSGNRRG